ncbi:hypothetical protein MJO28_010139 [Puccinia striiformis f. sp. tritici]|uniref:Uncharacterized protein n=1 Tax=Puccinia striiformis f. sp. tritici TaxID=168172 RepID=A0ACC0E3P0_9BASI|nr:hypothetical protein MJO28_010139 [Puccinia striiformis f. sp. tritici]
MGSLLDFLKFKITFKEVVPVQPKKKKKRRPSIISSSTNPNEPLPPGPSQKRAKTKSADPSYPPGTLWTHAYGLTVGREPTSDRSNRIGAHGGRGPLTATQSQLLKELEELEAPEMPEPISGFVCSFCSEPLPGPHSVKLQKSYRWYEKKSKGFTVPLSWTVTATYCTLHKKEFELIPQGHARGWPKEIDWPALPKRVYAMKKSLWLVARKKTPSEFFVAALKRWIRLGPSKAKSSYHGVDNFHGYVSIFKTLELMFLDRKHIDKTSALAMPMNAEHLVRKVLVPEVALRLIGEDLGRPIHDPMVLETLEDSRNYGSAVFRAGGESDSDDASDSE